MIEGTDEWNRGRDFVVHSLAGGPALAYEVRRRAETLGVDPYFLHAYALEVERGGKTYLVLDEDGLAALARYARGPSS